MNGYTLITYPRIKGKGGGVGIYIYNKYQYKIGHDWMNNSGHSHSESVFIEIKANKKTFIICSIYKPPDINTDSFNNELLSVLNIIFMEKKCGKMLGDFNLNLLNTISHQVTDFTNNMYVNVFYPTISRSTRITNNSSTLIGNIPTNITQHKIHSGILYSDIY